MAPAGLAAMISAAHKAKGDALVPLLSSNMSFDAASKADDSLQAHVEAGRILVAPETVSRPRVAAADLPPIERTSALALKTSSAPLGALS